MSYVPLSNQVICPNCKGGNLLDATRCMWRGASLAAKRGPSGAKLALLVVLGALKISLLVVLGAFLWLCCIIVYSSVLGYFNSAFYDWP